MKNNLSYSPKDTNIVCLNSLLFIVGVFQGGIFVEKIEQRNFTSNYILLVGVFKPDNNSSLACVAGLERALMFLSDPQDFPEEGQPLWCQTLIHEELGLLLDTS